MLFNLEPGADRQQVKAALVAARVSEEGSVLDRVPTASKLVQFDKARVASTPRVAAGLFAVTAAAVLIHSVIATGRKRRRELAIFRAIGFSARQATSASVWLALTSAFIALVVSVPIGAAVGARMWSLYAQSLGVGVRTSTRSSDIVLVIASALLGAVVVAFWPGWITARRATATTLRTE